MAEAQLVLVGDGPDETQLRRRAGGDVRLVGRRSDVADWLAAADVFALPSRWEGMSIGMPQALVAIRLPSSEKRSPQGPDCPTKSRVASNVERRISPS